ncbi:MAG: hypothetical protein PHW10_05020 [Candidatus Peribacteraceae bacterium]|nr:hypothetical protein [Candidatus Peribacteraceae bacterium]
MHLIENFLPEESRDEDRQKELVDRVATIAVERNIRGLIVGRRLYTACALVVDGPFDALETLRRSLLEHDIISSLSLPPGRDFDFRASTESEPDRAA